MRGAAGALVLVLLLGAGGACGGSGGSPAPVSLVDGVVVEVDALDNTFRPGQVEVAPGTVVRWTNVGRNEHNVLPVDGGGWGAEVEDFGPRATYEHRFTEPGRVAYYCSLHGTTTAGMVGAVVVAG